MERPQAPGLVRDDHCSGAVAEYCRQGEHLGGAWSIRQAGAEADREEAKHKPEALKKGMVGEDFIRARVLEPGLCSNLCYIEQEPG